MEYITNKTSEAQLIEIQHMLSETLQNKELQLKFKTSQKLNKSYEGTILLPQINKYGNLSHIQLAVKQTIKFGSKLPPCKKYDCNLKKKK